MSQQQQYQMMRNIQNGNMAMNMKQNNLARAAMANNQNNPQMMLQQAKQNQMQRDPSGMDGQNRPSSPASGENAPSPSKRQRIDGAPFNHNQPAGMMPNGRQMPGQQMNAPNTAAAQQMLTANGINPHSLHPQQLANFASAPPAAQQKSIATYSQNLQQHHGTQMGGKQMPNAVPQGQGSPMMAQGPDGTALNAFYNPGEMGGPGGIRPGPGGPQNGGGSNPALQDYQMQLMLLEQQNKKRLMMARQEQDTVGGNGMPREGQPGPGGPPGPNGQFPDTSPQAMRPGASPNPAEQMKRGTPQMNNSGIPSPVPEGGQSRGSPNPAMNFMGNNMDPNLAPHFFKGMEGNMGGQPPMNGNMRPPSSHPGQPFNGQMTPQMMAAARQQQQQGQPGQGPQGNPQQWQQGPNGQMVPQQMQQQSPQIQNTPQQRSMPPPQAPPAGANGANSRTTASPQQAAAAPPTPSQTNKAAPKKKESKAAKDKRAAANKKANQNINNAGATPSNDNNDSQDTPAPATPIQNANAANFNKNGQANAVQNGQQTSGPANAPAAATTAPPPAPPAPQHDPNQMMGMDNSFGPLFDSGGMELANPLNSGDVLNDFDFDSFLHDQDGDASAFNFTEAFPMGDEIGAD
jgi:hypothetical protein